jgi:predicted HTH transcriptional regulator
MREFFDSLTTIDRIQALIDTCQRESDNLEYKTATQRFEDKQRDEIAKDVSSFANSGGGVIIYGVATDPKDKTKPVAIEAIHAANIETFDRVVNSKIQPPVPRWQKRLIPNEQPRVMVIFVPQSDDPPHQNLVDKKYYRRAGIESFPMTHDLIALLSERAKRKRLRHNLQLQYD